MIFVEFLALPLLKLCWAVTCISGLLTGNLTYVPILSDKALCKIPAAARAPALLAIFTKNGKMIHLHFSRVIVLRVCMCVLVHF